MASKASMHRKTIARGVTVKHVKKANMWVVTFPRENKTVQEWFSEEPTEEQLGTIRESINL